MNCHLINNIKTCTYFLFSFSGILGASGTFSTFILLNFFGLTYIEAAGIHKVVSLSMDIVALIIYVIHHLIYYKYGLFLFFGTIIGSYAGASFGIKKGNQWMRIAFSIVTLVLAIKLLF